MFFSLRKLCALALFLPFFLSHTPAFGENGPTATPAPVRTTSLGYAIDAQPIGENLCALTFDDGPSRLTTPQLLKTLDSYGIPATFFVLGKNANFAPEIVKQQVAEGHEVGVHTYNHANLKAVSSARKKDEIARSVAVLNSLGIEPKVFRPPYGNRNAEVDELSHSFGMEVILWSHDTLDWKRLPADYGKLASGVKGVAAPGRMHGVILMHDIHQRSVDDVPRAIEQLKAAGCQRFVTVSDYLDTLFNDPEPSFLMTRHPAKAAEKLAAQQRIAGTPQQEEARASSQQTPQESPKPSVQQRVAEAPQGSPKASSQHGVAEASQGLAQVSSQQSAPKNEEIKVSLQEVLSGDTKNQMKVSVQDVLGGTPQQDEGKAFPQQKSVTEAAQETPKVSSQQRIAQAPQEMRAFPAQEATPQAPKRVVRGSLQEALAESSQEPAKEPKAQVEKKSYPPIAKVHVGAVAAKILAVQPDIAPRMVGTGYLANEEGKKTQLHPWSGFAEDGISLHPAKLAPVQIQSESTSLMDSMKKFF